MKISLISTGAILLVAFMMTSCRYAKEHMSDDLPAISLEKLVQGVKDKTLYVFDNNTREIFSKNHIPTATYMDVRKPDAKLLPANKDATLVFYCKNTWCMASHAGARFAREQGYKNSFVYPEGIDGWMEANQPVASSP